ncbi:hypothetical protein [Kitasatospora sp. NPDC088346]|uniref:hypothetical protein n=1 Tax=Kitasatospora sp. NPDC088346 TaxID=3364073 RepID=UPI003822CA23
MRVNFDGVTPMPRALMLSAFLLRPDFRVELENPVFVAVGDRVLYEGCGILVTRPTGERHRHRAGNRYRICR